MKSHHEQIWSNTKSVKQHPYLSFWAFRLIKVQFLGSCSGQFWIHGSYLNMTRKFPLLTASAFSLWTRRGKSCSAQNSTISRKTFKWSWILLINVLEGSEIQSMEAVACLLSQLKELAATLGQPCCNQTRSGLQGSFNSSVLIKLNKHKLTINQVLFIYVLPWMLCICNVFSVTEYILMKLDWGGQWEMWAGRCHPGPLLATHLLNVRKWSKGLKTSNESNKVFWG